MFPQVFIMHTPGDRIPIPCKTSKLTYMSTYNTSTPNCSISISLDELDEVKKSYSVWLQTELSP